MKIESERLLLDEISWDDLSEIHQLHSIPEVDEYNCLGLPKSIEDTRKIVSSMLEAQGMEECKSYTWKIVKKETKEFIGLAGMSLSLDKFKLGEIYYKLLPVHWGKVMLQKFQKH
jgi:RimJ/RimL family protein N-acetyltransferase